MGIELLNGYAIPCVIVATFLVGMTVIASRFLKRIIRAYLGDEGVDLPATVSFLLIVVMIVFCAISSWAAFLAPD
ncbi:MAG: hypothetical protein GY832_16685 [Chloroflexi bacterium]|nr:hypothetical protein [Chloroflexota bacterium]